MRFWLLRGVRFWPRRCKAKNGPLPKVGRGVRLWSEGVRFLPCVQRGGPFLEGVRILRDMYIIFHHISICTCHSKNVFIMIIIVWNK